MKKFIFLLMLFCFSSFSIIAQNSWTLVDSFSSRISDLIVYDNELYVGGNFTSRGNGQTTYWTSSYNGSVWDDQTSMIGGGGVDEFAIFQNDLYSVGFYQFQFSTHFIGLWTGTTWTGSGSFNYSLSSIYANSSAIYSGSDNGIVRKSTNGSTHVAMPTFNNTSGISSICEYNGEIIVSGGFDSSGTVELNHIARWDANSNSWQPLGTGLSGGARTMAVYNNELYVAGSFTTAGGVTVNKIARWNGSSWSDVAGGVTGGTSYNGLRDLHVANNRLYVVGDFSEIGSVAAKYVAYWDGSNWHALDLNLASSFPYCVTVYNGDIYVGAENTDSKLFKRSLSTSTESIEQNAAQITIYPNPTTDILHIDNTFLQKEGITSLTLMQNNGVVLKEIPYTNTLDVSNLVAGSYQLILKKQEEIKVVKTFVKF